MRGLFTTRSWHGLSLRKLPVLLALALVVAAAINWRSLDLPGIAPMAAARTTQTKTQLIATAAHTFLDTLSRDERRKALLSFKPQNKGAVARFMITAPGRSVTEVDEANPTGPKASSPGGPGMGPSGGFVGERYGEAVWSNYPVSDVLRPGLQLGSLTAPQRAAAMHLLQVLLSPKGYRKVLDIMGSDQALADSSTPFASGKDVYTIAIFGTPSTGTPWMIGFGGHHLGLNVVISGVRGTMTPTLTGAQPAVYKADGKTVRVLAGENDKAFALLDALDDSQRKQAILNYAVGDLVLGPGHAGETIVPEGLKASEMTPQQRMLLLDVISEWAGIVNDAYAKPRIDEIKAGLDDTWFAWSGPTSHAPGQNGSSYYRIQGPKLVIEFAPQSTNGDSTLHVHTIYRDPTNDYGVAFMRP
jgi:uncharacterized protein DUF3500